VTGMNVETAKPIYVLSHMDLNSQNELSTVTNTVNSLIFAGDFI
jgi:hypothetical protein